MSLILEALRKSEAERRRGDAPGLAMELPPVPPQRRRGIPVAAWIAAAVLAVAVAVVLLWPDASVDPAPTIGTEEVAADAPPSAPVAASPPAEPAHFPPVDRIPPPAPSRESIADVPLAPPPMATRAAEEAGQTAAASPPAPAAKAPAPAPAPAPDQAGPARLQPAAATPLRIASLPAGQRQRLPDMKLSMHMWNEDPARRFAVIDGQRRVEGDRLGEATITAIDRDGVLLDLDGEAVRVPLP